MSAESSGFYRLNMELLKKNYFKVWETVNDTDVTPAGEIVNSTAGQKNLKVEIQEDDFLYFHDKTDPGKEGEEFLAIVPENARGTVIFQGMGLGYGPLAVLENRENVRHLIIFELSMEIFLQALAANDLSVLLSDPRVIISLGDDPDVSRVFSAAALSIRLEETSMLTHNPSCRYEKKGYEKLGREIYNTANAFNISANTFKSYGTAFISNRLTFLKSIHHNSLIDSLKGKFKNVPAVMVAAGPSLDKNIDLLGKLKDRAVIISADSALPALLAHGVTPDFVTSIDYKDLTYEKIAACAPRVENLSLICSSWVGQKVARVFPADNIYWTFTGSAMETWINKGLGGDLVSPGAGTVAHLNMIAAIIMGCSPVIFTGQDLAFSEKSGGTDHTVHAVLKSNDQTSRLLKSRKDLFWVDGNNGGKVPTSRSFINHIDQFEKMIAANPGTYINATQGGAFIKGTEVMPLQDVLDKFCTKDHDISGSMKKYNKTGRIGNFNDFLVKIQSVLRLVKEMNNLIKKADKNSSFLSRELSKLQKSGKKHQSFDALKGKLQKTIVNIDKYNDKLDKKHSFWGFFDEATMNVLQSTERMKHDIDKLQDIPERYMEWLQDNLKRLDAVNLERKKLIDGFGRELSDIVKFHKQEQKFLKAVDNPEEKSTEIEKDVNLVSLAMLYCESGNFVLAKPLLEKIVKKEPENSEVCFNLGKIAALHTEFEKADNCFARALEGKPELKEKIEAFKTDSGDEYMGYAAQFWQYDRASSKNMIVKGLRFCPGHKRLIIEISAILANEMKEVDSDLKADNMESCKKVINQWTDLFQNQPRLENNFKKDAMASFYKNCGKFFQVSGDLLKAFEAFHKAIGCTKDNPEYYLLLSELMFEMGRNDQGGSYHEKAVQLDKEFVVSFENRKKAEAASKNRYVEARDELNLNQTGDDHFLNGRFEKAAACYEQALEKDADNPDIIQKLGTALKEAGDVERAVLSYNRAVTIDPDNFNAFYNMGVALQEMGRINGAVTAYQKAVDLKPDFLNALNNLGNAFNAKGLSSEAIDCYEKILGIDPGYSDALNNLGVVYQAMGRYEKAVSCYKQFLEIRPDNSQVMENLNRLINSQGCREKEK